MDIEKLIKQYRQAAEKWEKRHPVTDTFDLRVQDALRDAAGALSTLQAENAKLRAELKSKVDLVFQQAKELDRRHLLLQEQEAELEQVKRDFDGICEYINSEGFLRKQFCENGNPDLEPCICPSLQQHQGYIDSDDCEGCDHFCNSWRGPKEV